jgi:GT2 family glycosyltransferase
MGYRILYAPQAKLRHKESMTIGKTSPFKAYYDARNPIIIHMKYRTPDEFRKFFRVRFRELLHHSFKQLVKMKYRHLWAIVSGLVSAMSWGIRNRKLTLRHLF